MFMLSPCVFFSLNFNYNTSNTLFYKIHQGTERTHTCSVKKTFATSARLKQPLYVCIGQRFGWELYFQLLSELNRFRPKSSAVQIGRASYGVARTRSYLTLATSLLVDRFGPSWVTSRGYSSKRESRYVCRQSLTLDLG